MLKSKLKRAIWGCNIVIAVLCVLAIVSFFFMPFWSIKLAYTVQAETLQEMVGQSVEFDAKDIVGEDGVKLGISLEFKTGVLFKSYGNVDVAVDSLIEDNTNLLVDQLTDKLNSIVEKVVRTVTGTIVQKEVHDNIKNILSGSNPNISDEEVSRRLNDVGITDDFISSKTDAIIDKIYGGGSTVDEVCDEVVNTVDEIYEKLAASNDPELHTAELTEEDKNALRETVKDAMENFAAEGGELDANELIASLFLQALESMKGEKGGSAKSDAATPFAADTDAGATAGERLKTEVRSFLLDLIPNSVNTILAWVMRGMTILFIFSSFWWGYILVKLLVKVIKRKSPKVQKNPTVKLWTPIVFGWLPYLIFVGIPVIAFGVLKRFLVDKLPAGFGSILNFASFSFASAGLFAALAALVCFGISIFYIVARKKLKKAYAAESETEKQPTQEAAPAANPYYGNQQYNNPYYGNQQYGAQQYGNQQYGQYGAQQYGNQQYGGQYGNQQYGGQYGNQQYWNQQYGGQYGNQQYWNQQYGGQYGTQQYGNQQYGDQQYGNQQYDDSKNGQ